MRPLNRLKRHSLEAGPLETELFFPAGLFGFESCKRYILTGDSSHGLLRLKSLDNPSVNFYVTDPFVHYPQYEPSLTRIDLKDVGVIHEAKLIVLAIVDTNRSPPTMNLGAPLLIHWAKRIGKQLLFPQNAEHPLS